jgi:hypothetical protein
MRRFRRTHWQAWRWPRATLRLRSLVERRVLRCSAARRLGTRGRRYQLNDGLNPARALSQTASQRSGSPFPIQAAGSDEMRAQRQRLRLPALDCIRGGIVSSASTASGSADCEEVGVEGVYDDGKVLPLNDGRHVRVDDTDTVTSSLRIAPFDGLICGSGDRFINQGDNEGVDLAY